DSGPAERRPPGRDAGRPGQPHPAAHPRDARRRPRLRQPPGPRDRHQPAAAAHAPAAARGRRPRRRHPRAVRRRQGHEVLRGRRLRPAPHRGVAVPGGRDPHPSGPVPGSRRQGEAPM
ncbi:MAG: Transcriptional regulator, ArsR family, partial [uncultured Blastococcus sp.]